MKDVSLEDLEKYTSAYFFSRGGDFYKWREGYKWLMQNEWYDFIVDETQLDTSNEERYKEVIQEWHVRNSKLGKMLR